MRRTTLQTGTEDGFTLLEFFFVILIFTTLVSLAAPLFSRAQSRLALDRCSSDLSSLIDLARQRAVLEQIDYGIRFNPDRTAYQIVCRDAAAPGAGWESLAEKWGRQHPVPVGLTIRPSADLLVFYPDGTATPFSVELLAPSRAQELRVDAILGRTDARAES